MKLPRCGICTDVYDGEKIVAALPCGHIYHESCIGKWLENAGTCADCRQKYSRRNLTKLYLDYQTSDLPNLNDLEMENAQLKDLLALQTEKQLQSNRDIDELRILLSYKEESSQNLNKKLQETQSAMAAIKIKLSDRNILTSNYINLQKEYRELHSKFQKLKRFGTFLEGTEQETAEMLASYTESGPNALKDIATWCSALKRELRSMTEVRNKLSVDLERREKALTDLKSYIRRLEVRKQTTSAQQTPVGEKGKQRMKKSLAEADLTKTPEVYQCMPGPPPKKFKVNVVPLENTRKMPPLIPLQLSIRRQNIFAQDTSISDEENSITRNGYNGLGGRTKVVRPKLLRP